MTAPSQELIDVHLDAAAWQADRNADVRLGLSQDPPWLSPMWFYDEHGSSLFDEITRLPEYYQTRAERRLLQAHAADLAALGVEVLVELGSGTSDKTEVILDAMVAAGTLRTYVPFDVSDATMRDAIDRLRTRYADLEFHGVVGDFHRHLGTVPNRGRRLIAFLGGTIGNLRPVERARFLTKLHEAMNPGDLLLVGIDLLKEPDKIVAAYDDAAGVTAAFNRNALTVINRELHADFDPEAYDHVARWNTEEQWIEMRLRARRPQRITVADLDVVVALDTGEEILTEISAKFSPAGFAGELAVGGFTTDATWAADGDEFALVLAHRRETEPTAHTPR